MKKTKNLTPYQWLFLVIALGILTQVVVSRNNNIKVDPKTLTTIGTN